MGKLQDFLMKSEKAAQETAEVAIQGFPHPFLIHSITEEENQAIRSACQEVRFDKRTHQKQVELDQDRYNKRFVAACCSDPNFKDAALQEKFGVRGEEELIGKTLRPGQFLDLLLAVQDVNGFSDDINELRDEAKN